MRTITAGQLRARLGETLDSASAGERLVIERDHRPIAAIVPIEDVQQLEGATEEARRRKLAALERITARARALREAEPAIDDGLGDAAAWIRWDRDHGHRDG